MSGMTGRVYLERGQPVTVLIAYCGRRAPDVTGDWLHFQWPGRRPAAGPRNVAILRTDGSIVVRPFRGLTLSAPTDRPSRTPSRPARRDIPHACGPAVDTDPGRPAAPAHSPKEPS
ncbi:hypothetical protein GCM10010276_88360 [Streptomyces longisporus]|uniref:Uncharacterized protein n=1 Tax=Streptomyces longisporus TaxID=1948 RepID=A0ABN3NIM7_STRLO